MVLGLIFSFFGGNKKPKTKKEKILARMRRIHIIRFAIRLHQENDKLMQRARGGYAKPDKDDGNLDKGWRGKVGQLKDRVQSARAKLDMMRREQMRSAGEKK